MKKLHSILALAILSSSFSGPVVLAQDQHDQDHHDSDRRDNDRRDNHSYVEHREWKKGRPMHHEDWDRGEHVDYRERHLSTPPSGYEWRMVDGQYILANSSNFQIRTVIRIP